MNSFFKAVKLNDVQGVRKILETTDRINEKDEYGYSALHVASFKDLEEMCQILIEKGIHLNTQDKNGQTILHYTALNNQLNIAKKVLEAGGSLNIEDNFGNEPLWTAIFNDKGRNERIEIINLYIHHGGNINHKNKIGKSPKDIILIAGYDNLKPYII